MSALRKYDKHAVGEPDNPDAVRLFEPLIDA
jgi:hypothetical protein